MFIGKELDLRFCHIPTQPMKDIIYTFYKIYVQSSANLNTYFHYEVTKRKLESWQLQDFRLTENKIKITGLLQRREKQVHVGASRLLPFFILNKHTTIVNKQHTAHIYRHKEYSDIKIVGHYSNLFWIMVIYIKNKVDIHFSK